MCVRGREVVHSVSVVVLLQEPLLNGGEGVDQEVHACGKPGDATSTNHQDGVGTAVARVVQLLGLQPFATRQEE